MSNFVRRSANVSAPLRAKPEGGFCFVSVEALYAAWFAYRRAIIRLEDLRVFFAAIDLPARRWGLEKGRVPRFRLDELEGWVGRVGEARLRSSLRRLSRSRLLTWSESAISVTAGRDSFGDETREAFIGMLEGIANHRRKVPVPRRTLRLLAGGARRGVISTVLGHLFRCVYYRSGGCRSEGTAKSTWIAQAFEIDVRNVKAARKHLAEIGWLIRRPTAQWRMNRFGPAAEVNLGWAREGFVQRRKPRNDSSLRGAVFATLSPPPESDWKLSSRAITKNPAPPGAAGFSKCAGSPPQPTMRHIVAEDLVDPERLRMLFREGVRLGLVSNTECDWLKLFGAAEHARVIGTKNPCGLFATIVRRRLWHHITQADEDAARRRTRDAAFAFSRGARRGPIHARPAPAPACDSTQRSPAIRALVWQSLQEADRVEQYR